MDSIPYLNHFEKYRVVDEILGLYQIGYEKSCSLVTIDKVSDKPTQACNTSFQKLFLIAFQIHLHQPYPNLLVLKTDMLYLASNQCP